MKAKAKKRWVWLVAVMFFLAGMQNVTATSGNVDTTEARLVAATSTTPTGHAGKDMQVKLTIRNVGDADAVNISVSPVVKSGSDSPFVTKNAGLKTISYIYGTRDDSETVTFTFTVKEKAITGYYAVDFDVLYSTENSNGVGGVKTTTLTAYVYIEGVSEEEAEVKTDIQVSLRNSPKPAPAAYGHPLLFDIILTNYGKSDLRSVTVTPKLSEDSHLYPFKIEKATYEEQLPSSLLGIISQPDEQSRSQRVHYSMIVREDVATGYYPVTFVIKGKDEKGEDYAVEQTVYFDITGKEEKETEEETGRTSEPRVIVTGYETDVNTVKAGDVFRLTIHIKNTSTVTAVRNMKFTLSAANEKGDIFLPLSGSSTMFVNHIGSGETVDLEIDLTARNDLEARSYPLTITSEYEDSKANPYKAMESISIPVTQELRLSVGEVEIMPASIEIGSQANVMFAINNLGKSKIYNVSISFEGDSITGGDAYKGNVESGATSNVDVMVTGLMPTMDEGMVRAVITYENERGHIFTEEKEFSLYVFEPYIPEMGELDPGWMETDVEPVKTGSSWIVIAGIAAGTAAVIAAVAVITIKRRKRKKEEGMDEDEIL